MKLIIVAIIPLIVISLLSVLFGSEISTIEIITFKYNKVDQDVSQIIREFNLDAETYGMTFFVIITATGAAMGLRILGSGIADTSIRVIILIIMYSALWVVLSILSNDLLFSNANIGLVIYIFLTILYIIGVSQSIGGST